MPYRKQTGSDLSLPSAGSPLEHASLTKRSNIGFKVIQSDFIPIKSKGIYLDRSFTAESANPPTVRTQNTPIDKDEEIKILHRVIEKVKKNTPAEATEEAHEEDTPPSMERILRSIFLANIRLEPEFARKSKSISAMIAQEIEGGLSCQEAFLQISTPLKEKFAANQMTVPIADFLNTFSIALGEVTGSGRTIKQLLSQAREPFMIFTEVVIPADFVTIREYNEKHPDQKCLGFVRNNGSANDHIDTLCAQYGLCSVILNDDNFDFKKVKDYSTFYVMSVEGSGEGRDLIFKPDELCLEHFNKEVSIAKELDLELPIEAHPPYTRCRHEITFTVATSNLKKPEDELTDQEDESKKLDDGLLRLELLVDDEGRLPTESKMTEALKLHSKFKSPKKVNVRMPDCVADKLPKTADSSDIIAFTRDEDGKKFDMTGDLILLANPENLFGPAVRSTLRAAEEMPNIRIMFPQVTNHVNCQLLIDFVNAEKVALGMEELNLEFIPMIEFVRAANSLEKIVAIKGVTGISIGSNDFVNDVLGINRYNKKQANDFSMCHYDVIFALSELKERLDMINSKRTAAQGEIDVSICGKMAGDPRMLPILIGLGFRKFCVDGSVGRSNRMVALLDVKECQQLVEDILAHTMKPGESIYHEFILPFIKKQPELNEELKKHLVPGRISKLLGYADAT